MADTVQEMYYGMLTNMPAECGPIGIIVDTTAKTVTTLLANPDSGYSVSGGGGLEYVVPEQTLTFTNSSAYTYLTNSGNLDDLVDDDQLIFKTVIPDAPPGEPAQYLPSYYYDGTLEGSSAGGAQIEVTKDSTGWKMLYSIGAPVYPITLKISAVGGF